MFRSKLNFIVILFTCSISLNALAQSTLFSSPSSKAQQVVIPGVSKVMTPQEFQSQVKELGQQTQDKAQQDAKELIAKQQGTADTSAPSSTSTAVPSSDQAAMENAFSNTPAPAPPAKPAPRSTTEVPSGLPEPPADAGGQSAPVQQQSQPYTGFGGNNSGSNGSSSPQKSSGGWNIKY